VGPTYRPDIDGLRAVAILCVLLFHAAPHRFPGGYIGVDVFFVISGFVITGLMLNGLSTGTFSFGDFYARRVRRIAPALTLICAACLVAGWFLLLPDEFAQLGEHVAGAAVSISNLLLWGEAGYFNKESAAKPLLHLWSLGVEIQFYALWPLALVGLARMRQRRGRTIGVAVLGLLSFAAGLTILDRDPVSAFYLPFARFWELILGGWLACVATESTGSRLLESWNRSTLRSTLTSLAGMALILWSARVRGDRGDFPGWAAVPPTFGTLLVLLSGPGALWNRIGLANRPMVMIGKISYPLYLWHWPLLAFTRIAEADQPTLAQRTTLVGLSFVLAALTYRLVEIPSRDATRSKRGFVALCGALALAGLAGFAIFMKEGFPNRVDDRTAAADLSAGPVVKLRGRQTTCPAGTRAGTDTNCRLSAPGTPAIALLGDSHAHHLLAGISEFDRSRTWLMLNDLACPPVTDVSVSLNQRQGCEGETTASIKTVLADPSLRTVVLSSFAGYVNDPGIKGQVQPTTTNIKSSVFAEKDPRELVYLGLDRTVTRFEADGRDVVLVFDVPELPFFPRDCVRREWLGLPDRCFLSREEAVQRQAAHREIVRRIAAGHPRLRVFDPYDVLCPGSSCAYKGPEHLYYSDSHHLTVEGSGLVARVFLEWLAASERRGESVRP
jgi:peptidoglycan/LPS O-acetylase OafA/YrhL